MTVALLAKTVKAYIHLYNSVFCEFMSDYTFTRIMSLLRWTKGQ